MLYSEQEKQQDLVCEDRRIIMKKNFGSKMVKKAITWAMVITMSLSASMSSLATATVYAEERPEAVIEVPDMIEEEVKEAADAADAAADAAQVAADTATEAVEAIENIDIAPAQNEWQLHKPL